MKTVNMVIAHVDELTPNAYSDMVKAGWLEELEGKISVEVIGVEPPQTGPEHWDTALLAQPPYDNIYELYVLAMVDFYNQELDRYGCSMALFNTAMDEYRKWYWRTHRPKGAVWYRNVM